MFILAQNEGSDHKKIRWCGLAVCGMQYAVSYMLFEFVNFLVLLDFFTHFAILLEKQFFLCI